MFFTVGAGDNTVFTYGSIPAGNVAGHEAQAWYAVLGHVQVVASLPGALARGVEVGVLHRVGQEDGVPRVVAVHRDVIERLIAIHALMRNCELVGADCIGGREGECGVADVG